MRWDKLQAIKGGKPFFKWDIAVYTGIFSLLLLLVFWFVLPAKKQLNGVEIYCDGELVCSYSIESGGQIQAGWEEKISTRRVEERVEIRIEKDGFNLLVLDLTARVAYMQDADCSTRKDCVCSAPITSAFGVIVCVPHAVKVCAMGGDDVIAPPVLG